MTSCRSAMYPSKGVTHVCRPMTVLPALGMATVVSMAVQLMDGCRDGNSLADCGDKNGEGEDSSDGGSHGTQ